MTNISSNLPLPPIYSPSSKAVKKDIQNIENAVFNTKDINTQPPIFLSNKPTPTLNIKDNFKDNMNIDFKDLKKTPPNALLLTKEQESLLNKGISVNVKLQGEEMTIAPKEVMDKIKIATSTNQPMSIRNEDGTTYKLLKTPPSSGILVMSNDKSKTRMIMSPLDNAEHIISSDIIKKQENNIVKTSFETSQENLLNKGISVNVKFQGEEMTILPKEAMDKIKIATSTNQPVSIENEDGTTYKLVQPPLNGVLVMKNDRGAVRLGMLPLDNSENIPSSEKVKTHGDNITKMSIMSKIPSGNEIYKTDDVFAKIKNGEFIYRGFKI